MVKDNGAEVCFNLGAVADFLHMSQN
jgi:hypothetical protein